MLLLLSLHRRRRIIMNKIYPPSPQWKTNITKTLPCCHSLQKTSTSTSSVTFFIHLKSSSPEKYIWKKKNIKNNPATTTKQQQQHKTQFMNSAVQQVYFASVCCCCSYDFLVIQSFTTIHSLIYLLCVMLCQFHLHHIQHNLQRQE